ncbi:MAG TPA: ribosome maturation factor RimP [Candidatus Syntrophosphaera sp.]|jgi:ribosome maturation factor RimP|nr:ribosome maturation factor RimP [Candidatus Cloacimonadota bacterium]OQB90746.1 MAG: Ribosome maturation factor RimP [Candidatus Cloacimonetes bacterium ADurb.Bin117]HNU53998.1 ribosome maturation factor RimP [Candidatus Syntrophosphaera sp.]MDI9525003.1 ribosome maturation factor RimP [Candidatus Cloacimonadota bacterium]NLH93263.1 ribosome maturation factor RimP [Candidatus Cloacimonadota bacterium]
MEYYRPQVEEIARRICLEQHLALYDLDEKMSGKGRIITVYLTKIGGVTLDECARFSRALGAELEEFDLIPDRYFLEVSSPGLERPLKLKSHWVSAINEKVAVQWTEGEQKRSALGTLVEVNQDNVVLDDRGSRVEIELKAISRAKTVYLASPKREEQ